MSSIIYNSCLYGVFRSIIHFDVDVFKIMLVTSEYLPDKANHNVRSDVNYEIPNSDSYMQGGKLIDVSMIKDEINNRIDVILNGATWEFSTISAGGAVYYKSRGIASIDDLVCYVQFGQSVSSVDGNFVVTPSRIRIQN